MKVRDIMQRKVTVIAEDESLALAQQLMLWNEIRHLPVLRPADGKLVGLLSERDVLRALQTRGTEAATARVGDFMTTPVDHIHPDADVADAAADLSTKKLGCLPVVEVGSVVGLVSVGDVVGTMAVYPADRRKSAHPDSSIASIMYPEPIAVHEDDTVLATAQRMLQRGVRHACIVDGEGGLVGIVSDRDLRRVLGDPRRALDSAGLPDAAKTARIGEVMTGNPRTIDQDDSIRSALDLLLSERVGALPVVDARGRLRGIVSYLDVLRYFAEATA